VVEVSSSLKEGHQNDSVSSNSTRKLLILPERIVGVRVIIYFHIEVHKTAVIADLLCMRGK
jgi:hypothetical protein